MVGINYFTKWVEVVPLVNIDREALVDFIQNHIVYIFRIPESLTTDQGSVFIGQKMAEFP